MEDQAKQKTESEQADFQVIDKRHFVNIDQLDATTSREEKPRYPSFVEELMARMAETERKFQEKKQQIDDEIIRTKTRLEADFDRRLEREKQSIILPFLEVLDNLQRATSAASQSGSVEHLLEGVRMTANMFRAKLQTIGVEPIAALGQSFDPNLQQAVGTVKIEDARLDGVVVEEVQPGYCINGQLLRPAQVRVGRHD